MHRITLAISSVRISKSAGQSMDLIPIAIFWALALWGLVGKPQVILYLIFGSMSFGAFAVVPPEFTAGLTLTPTPMLGILLSLKMFLGKGGAAYFQRTALLKRGPVFLTSFWLVALITTILMPRLFEGDVWVIPVRAIDSAFGEPLQPTPQNFSQLAYLSVSTLAVFAFSRHTYQNFTLSSFLPPIQFGGYCAVISGATDFASQFINLNPLLDPLRTATYALLTSDEVLGNKRIVGLMPEASAYGLLCIFFLSILYFCRCAAPSNPKAKLKNTSLVLALLAMAALSTSSAAYVSIIIFVGAAGIEWFQFEIVEKRRVVSRTLVLWVLILSGIAIFITLTPGFLAYALDVFNTMVIYKKETASYEERTMWTTTSLEALADTYGLGVGIGSTRTSNFIAAIFSNSGVVGGLLFTLFILFTLFSKKNQIQIHQPRMLQRGIVFAFIAPVVTLALIGTTPDFGLANAYLLGLSIGLIAKFSRQTRGMRIQRLGAHSAA